MGDRASGSDQRNTAQGSSGSPDMAERQIEDAPSIDKAAETTAAENQANQRPKLRGVRENLHRTWTYIKSPEATNLIMAAATVVIAVFTALTFLLVLDSGQDTQKLITAAETQADAATEISQAAGDQVDAANNFADTAEDINNRISDAVDQLQSSATNTKTSIETTKEAMRLDQRAWIGTEQMNSIPATPEVDKTWDISATLRNSGKTPAKSVVMWNSEGVLKDIPDVNADCKEAVRQKASNSMLPPNAINSVVVHVANGIKMPKTWESEITSGGSLYFHGCVLYDDIFGKKHWMTYCGSFDLTTKNSFLACRKYNDTGDGDPPRQERQKPN